MRKFKVTLTTNNNSGPFDIYYVSNNESVLAPLVTGSYATDITAAQLVSGVEIQADYGVSSINVYNKKDTCNNVASIVRTPQVNPFDCVAYLVKNNSFSTVVIQYTDCKGATQTITVGPGGNGSFNGIINSPTCISGDCNSAIVYLDPQYCKYYNVGNSCPDISVDVKYVNCEGVKTSISIPPNTTTLVKGISGTLYNAGGNCGIPPSINPTTDPNIPQGECTIYKAVNKCDSTDIIVKYTDCSGETQTLDLPAGSSQSFTSLFNKYECISGNCNCLTVVTQTSTCGFDFSISSYTPPTPVIPDPTYTLTPRGLKYTYKEGETITIDVATTNVDSGTQFYWEKDGSAGNGDLSAITGTITVNDNKSVFTIDVTADNLTEGVESFNIKLFTSDTNKLVATSKTFTIEDTSKTQTFTDFEVIATDPFSYNYEYKNNQVSIPPHFECAPTVYPGQPTIDFIFNPTQIPHGYFYKRNGVPQSRKPMASAYFTPSQFPHNAVPKLNPQTTAMSFTGSTFPADTDTITFTGGAQRVYPINNQILTFDNIVKNTETAPYIYNKLPDSVGGMYAYFVPRTSTYAVTGSIPFSFKGNDTGGDDQAGPSVFRIAGVLEQSSTPNNNQSWQYITHTTASIIGNGVDQNGKDRFKYNKGESTFWFDFDMKSEVQLNLAFSSSISLTAAKFVRFTLYWIDLSGAFYDLPDRRASNYLNFTIGPNSRLEIKDLQFRKVVTE